MNENDLIEALQNALLENLPNRPAGYRTRVELEELLSLSENEVLKRLRSLSRQGRLESTRVPIKNIAGGFSSTPAYKLIQEVES